MIELLNVEIAKSGKIMADEACRGVSQYTLRYRYVTWSGLHPDTPHPCVSAQCNFRFSSASSSIRSLRSVIDLRRAGSPLACCRLSRCCSFGDESSDSPSNTLRSSQTHETGLNARQGMEGAKNAYRGSQEVRRADTPNQGLSGR